MFAAKKSPCDAINTALKASESKSLCNIGVNCNGVILFRHFSISGQMSKLLGFATFAAASVW